MARGLESRVPKIEKEKEEIKLTPEEELIKRGIDIEREREGIKKMPEVQKLKEEIRLLVVEKEICEGMTVRMIKGKKEGGEDKVKAKEIEAKIAPLLEKQKSFFKEVDDKRLKWNDDRDYFLKKITHEKMGHWPEITKIKKKIESSFLPGERKLTERELEENAMDKFEWNRILSDKKRSDEYIIVSDKIGKDFEDKLDQARKEGKGKEK